MPSLKLRIPRQDKPFYGDGSLAVAAKAKLTAALERITELPAPRSWLSSEVSESVTIWVSDAQNAVIEELNTTHRLDGLGPAASALLHAWALSERQGASPSTDGDGEEGAPAAATAAMTRLDQVNDALGDRTRFDQALFFQRLSTELHSRRPAHEVIFAEASTGIGKTRAFVAAILDWCATRPDTTVALAAPSYNVLLQAVGLWSRLSKVISDMPVAVTLLGQQEYVSQHSLERVLHEHPEVPGAEAAKDWMEAGGPAGEDDPLEHRWLMRSLRAVTNGAWNLDSQVQLSSEDSADDPGMRAYVAQFASARDAHVVFCTHAMLAVDVRLRSISASRGRANAEKRSASTAAWETMETLSAEARRKTRYGELLNDLLADWVASDAGRLPDIDLLIVDEGHLLEESFSRVFASGISIASLVRTLNELRDGFPRLIKAEDLSELRDVWSDLKIAGGKSNSDTLMTSEMPLLGQAVSNVRGVLQRILARDLPKKAVALPSLRYLRQTLRALQIAAQSQGERTGMATRVSWSPSAHWPSIEVGRYDVSRELDFLWKLCINDRSVVVSATLFDDVSTEGMANIRRMLSVRDTLVRPLIPVRPSWLIDPVTLYLPGNTHHPDGLARFRRPSERDKADPVLAVEQAVRWRDDISGYTTKAYQSAAGGMLVLMTSHAERAEIERRIDMQIPSGCLISQREGQGIEYVRMQYLRACADGLKPCLLAVGSAWTGLDLSGDGLGVLLGRWIPPEEDNVLTDLVIPVAPIGINRSLTHQWRRERLGVMAELGALSMGFRQGVGRLIRREGLPNNRRLHFLDARIHETSWNSLLHPVKKALAAYPRRVEI